MSSWLPTCARRVPLIVLVAIGCQKETTGREQPPASDPGPAAATPPPAPRPWFQGSWVGDSAQLDIDQAGTVTGLVQGDLGVRGVVDEDTVRLDAEGPSGHGVAVLHREHDVLRGFLHCAPPGALEGSRVALALSRTEPR